MEIESRNLFRTVGRQFKENLIAGTELNMNLVVDLLVSKIKLNFEFVSQENQIEETKKKILREEEIKQDLLKADEMRGKSFRNSIPIDENSLNKEIEKLNEFPTSGYIITDFPNSAEQMQILEQKLSGFVPKLEREPCERELASQKACKIVTPSDKPLPYPKLIESGLDQVVWLETDRKEC